MDDIELFPSELIVKIIRYIPIAQWPSLERVCQKFCDCVHESWKALDKISVYDDLLASVKYGPRHSLHCTVDPQVSVDLFAKLLSRTVNLIDISDISNLTGFQTTGRSNMICSNLTQFTNLQRIDFTAAGVTISDLAMLLTESMARDKLKELILTQCIAGSLRATDHEQFAAAFSNTEDPPRKPLRLEAIEVEENRNALWFDSPMKRSFLETIDVSRLTSFLALDTYLERSKLVNFINRAIHLKKLSFNFSCYYKKEGLETCFYHPPNLTESIRRENAATLKAIEKLTDLESLSIGTTGADRDCDCRNVSLELAALFRSFNEHHREDGSRLFEDLALHGCMGTTAFIDLVATHLPNLKSMTLCLSDLIDGALKRVLRSQTQLRLLHLKEDEMGRRVVDVEDILGCATTLRELSIDFTDATLVRDDFKLLAQLKQLQRFTFQMRLRPECTYSIDESVCTAWADGFGANLVWLDISGNVSMTDNGVKALLSKAPLMELLRLVSKHLSDSILEEIATSCRVIIYLDLHVQYSSDHKWTQQVVQELLDKCKRLKSLGLCEYTGGWYPGELNLDRYRRINL